MHRDGEGAGGGGGGSMMGILAVLLLVAAALFSGIHSIKEGHVGVYWRGGALLEYVAHPGFHFRIPGLDTMEELQVTMQTDSVRNIPCGTSGGVMIEFEGIEVVNRLRPAQILTTVRNYGVHYDRVWIFDKIHHEINQFCSRHTLREVYIDLFDTLDETLAVKLQEDCDKYETGIEIIAVRATKPRLPMAIREGFEKVEREKTALLHLGEKQRVVEKEAEIEKFRAQQQIDREVLQREGERTLREIQNKIHVDEEKAFADAQHYKSQKQTEADQLKLSDRYLRHQYYEKLGNIQKIYFGDRIPNLWNLPQWDETAPTKSEK